MSPASELGEQTVLFSGVQLYDSRVGAFSYVQSSTVLVNADIGPFCSIAGNVTIGLAAHPTHMVSTSPVFYDPSQPLPRFFAKTPLFTESVPRTTVGADVWIGQGAMLRAGITVGPGAVIGAAAVVTRDVEPYAIVAGVPAKALRSRFSDDICRRLLASRWWELPEATLAGLAGHFAEPERLLESLERKP